ncbi:MAG: Mth938-like domain-containing protein [Burkholderiales bacterium]
MKLHRSVTAGVNVFTAYGEDYVVVSGERHASSLIVLPDRVLPWTATSFAALSEADFAPLADLGLEIVLLGTGRRLRFPPPALTRPLVEARVGLEVMDLQAACRTYNILVAEERKVAAALLFE